MSTLRVTNLLYGTTSISNLVLDGQGRVIFGPDSSFGRAALYVDPQTNRVGVNTESPTATLDVDGSINATGNLNFGGVLTLTGDLAIDTDTLYVNSTTHRVGLNTTEPFSLLQIGHATTPGDENYITFGKAYTSSQSNLPAISQFSTGGGNDLALATRSTSGGILFYTGNVIGGNDGLNVGTGDNGLRLEVDNNGQVKINPGSINTAAQSETLIINGYADGSNIVKVFGENPSPAPFVSMGLISTTAYFSAGNSAASFCDLAFRCTPATGTEATELFISSNDGTYAVFFAGDQTTNNTGDANNLQIQGGSTSRPRLSLLTNDTSIADTAELGRINFWSNDGGWDELAYVRCLADEAFSTGNKGSRLSWGTTANGATTPTEHLILSSAGDLTVKNVLNVREAIDLADDDILRFGSGDDVQVFHNGSHLYIDMYNDDDIIIRDANSTNLVAFYFDTSARRLYVQDNIYAGYNNQTGQYNTGTSNLINTYVQDSAYQTDTWTSYVGLAADWRGRYNEATNESTHHYMATVKDRAGHSAVMSKIDVSGSVWGAGTFYAGRTQSSTTSTATNYYKRGTSEFIAYNGSPLDTDRLYSSSSRAWIKTSAVWEDADDRKAIYGVKSDTDSAVDTDQDQYIACSAMGRFDAKGGIRSGRVESDEPTPNSIYAPVGWGGGNGILSYTTNSNSYTAIAGRTTANTDYVYRVRVNQSSDKVRIQADGQAYTDGAWNNSPADYAEYFEWEDGNPTDEDRRGVPVVLATDGKIRVATAEDNIENIIGVISAHPAFIGDAAELSWHGLYEKDEFGAPVKEDELWLIWKKDYKDGLPINQPRVDDPDTWDTCEGFPLSQLAEIEAKMEAGVDMAIPRWAIDQRCIVNKPKQVLSKTYDESKVYIPRSKRKEWDTVGLIGKLPVVKGSPVGSRWIKMGEINTKLDRYFVR